MLFVQYLFSHLNGTILAFRGEEGHFGRKQSRRQQKQTESDGGMKGIMTAGNRVVQSADFKYCSPAELRGKWKLRSQLRSITECLPGICLFNPLSKGHLSLWCGGGTCTSQEEMNDGGRMHVDETHPHTHPPTRHCSHAETHAQIRLMRTSAITQKTADSSARHIHYKCLLFVQICALWTRTYRTRSAWWRTITERDRDAEREREMFFQCETGISCQNYVPSHCTMHV